MHRTRTDVTFVEHFIMFHCHRKLIINYNFYEHFFYESSGKLLEDIKKQVLRVSDMFKSNVFPQSWTKMINVLELTHGK